MQRGSLFKKIIIGVLLVLGITAAAGFLYWNSNKERIVRQKIEQAVAGKTGLYKVDYDDMQLNELDGYRNY